MSKKRWESDQIIASSVNFPSSSTTIRLFIQFSPLRPHLVQIVFSLPTNYLNQLSILKKNHFIAIKLHGFRNTQAYKYKNTWHSSTIYIKSSWVYLHSLHTQWPHQIWSHIVKISTNIAFVCKPTKPKTKTLK